MNPYRIAFIGIGNVVSSHLQAIEQAGERAQLVAAMDINAERLGQVCNENNIPHRYTDAAQMLADIQPDLVHILTPPYTHFPLILQCLEAGASVYCEKPLCASLDQFDRIREAEAATGNYVSTVFQWRFGSAARHLKCLIEAGGIRSAVGRSLPHIVVSGCQLLCCPLARPLGYRIGWPYHGFGHSPDGFVFSGSWMSGKKLWRWPLPLTAK